jgi:O-antigen/teichoic acid export membrane protein
MALALLFVPLADLGVSPYLQVQMSHQRGDASALLSFSARTRLILLVPAAAVLAVVFPHTAQSAGVMVVLPVAYLALQSWLLHTDIAFIGRERPISWTLRRVVLESTNLVAVMLLFWMVASPSPSQVLLALVVALGIAAIAANLGAFRLASESLEPGAPPAANPSWLPTIMAGLPFFVWAVLQVLGQRLLTAALPNLITDEAAAQFRVCLALASLGLPLPRAANQVVMPRISRQHVAPEGRRSIDGIRLFTSVTWTLAAAVSIGCALLGGPLVALVFGDGYAGLTHLAAATGAAVALAMAYQPLSGAMNWTGSAWPNVGCLAIGTALSLGLLIPLTTHFGVEGTAWALAAGGLGTLVCAIMAIKRHVGTTSLPLPAGGLALAMAVAGCAAGLALPEDGLWIRIGTCAVFLSVPAWTLFRMASRRPGAMA